MRLAWFVGACILLIPSASAQWEAWIEDDAGDATLGANGPPSPDGRHDLVSVDVYFHDGFLHLRLRSGSETELVPDGYMSRLSFQLVASGSRSVHLEADEDGFRVVGPDLPATAYGWAAGSQPWGYHAWLDLDALVEDLNGTIRLADPEVLVWHHLGQGDTASGRPLALNQSDLAILTGVWREMTGPDFAGGTSIAVDGNGTPHLAYYVYDDRRDSTTGIYHVSLHDGWHAERVADYRQGTGRDDRMRTVLAVDGAPHMLFTADPDGGSDQLRYATRTEAGWSVEDPTLDHVAANHGESVPAIAASDGRVVAAFEGVDGVVIVERGGSGWTTLHEFAGGSYPRLGIDEDGQVHAAFARMSGQREGDLLYAKSPDWQEIRIGGGLDGGWETPETDGSFDFALAPDGAPAFVWDGSRDDSDSFAFLRAGQVEREEAPLRPSHGNPQYTLRLAFDAQGQAHVGGGYGGTDLYAIRTPDGDWLRRDMPRHDVWDMAVSAQGVPHFGYTQPHGGTTVAVSWLEGGLSSHDSWAPPDRQHDEAVLPEYTAPAPLLVMALALAGGLRRVWA